mgnify:CR=1 FL=1
MSERQAFADRLSSMIRRFENGDEITDDERDALIEDLARWQVGRIEAYGRLARRGAWPPALPTDVFRYRRIAAHPAEEDIRVFRSSGTTSSDRSVHAYRDLSLYDSAARAAAPPPPRELALAAGSVAPAPRGGAPATSRALHTPRSTTATRDVTDGLRTVAPRPVANMADGESLLS